jgi:hypothetical protein
MPQYDVDDVWTENGHWSIPVQPATDCEQCDCPCVTCVSAEWDAVTEWSHL